MKIFKFTPKLTHHSPMLPRSQEEIEQSPILYQCDYNFAINQAGKSKEGFSSILWEFISKLPSQENVIIDSRVHLLMKEWCPAIPGFHLDHVPRILPEAQPDLQHTTFQDHYMCVIGNDISSPEFVVQPITLEIDESKPIYEQCNKQILDLKPDLMQIKDNNIWRFSSQDFHRAVYAQKTGWRYFIRASYNTGITPKNKIRHQCQVYLKDDRGW